MTSDLDRLQGTWSVTALELDGQQQPDALFGAARVSVKGGRFTSTGMGAKYSGRVALDASARPRRFDLRFDAGPEKGNTNLGIYELRGDRWRLCLATRGDVRPERFASTPGSGIAVQTLRRGEATAKAVPKKAKKPAPRRPRARTNELEGEWTMLSGIFDGKPLPASETKWVRRITEGNLTTVTAGPQLLMKFEFTCGDAPPGAIDYLHLAGQHAGKTQLGLFELSGDRLTVHVGAAGGARPKSLAPAKAGTLTVWKRAR
jgi:uncharacterized protein (TIGR03067 family)